MRVSGGRARGIPLQVPRGARFRPAIDRLRQGVFSSLGSRVEGCRFLDLFAGTGSYGLEAISRGAAGGVFVERNAEAVASLRSNISAVSKSLGLDSAVLRVSVADAFAWNPPTGQIFDLVFADPPFEGLEQAAPSIFRRVASLLRSDPPGLFVFEMPGEIEPAAAGWRMIRRIGRGRGQPTCGFFERFCDEPFEGV